MLAEWTSEILSLSHQEDVLLTLGIIFQMPRGQSFLINTHIVTPVEQETRLVHKAVATSIGPTTSLADSSGFTLANPICRAKASM